LDRKDGREHSVRNQPFKGILVAILVSAAPLATANDGLMDATVTDSLCAANHKSIRLSCDETGVRSRIKAGAKYVLWDGKNAYVLSDQKAADQWAARKVRVLATLDAKTRQVRIISIVAR
jgi:hypothetical protein